MEMVFSCAGGKAIVKEFLYSASLTDFTSSPPPAQAELPKTQKKGTLHHPDLSVFLPPSPSLPLTMWFSIFLFSLVFLNLIKIPFQILPPPPHGHEVTPWMTLLAPAWRGNKMQSDPILFLFLHTLLGSMCVALWSVRFLTELSAGAATAAAGERGRARIHERPKNVY